MTTPHVSEGGDTRIVIERLCMVNAWTGGPVVCITYHRALVALCGVWPVWSVCKLCAL